MQSQNLFISQSQNVKTYSFHKFSVSGSLSIEEIEALLVEQIGKSNIASPFSFLIT